MDDPGKAGLEMLLAKVEDFQIGGCGNSSAWRAAEWQPIRKVGKGKAEYPTRFKALYSEKGLYFLFDCEDRMLTCSNLPDFGDLFKEDVIELFLWPDERHPLYFEYEASPLGAQLPILVSNNGGSFCGWQPWHYEDGRLCLCETSVRGGEKAPRAEVKGWLLECFIPFELFRGVCAVPEKGDSWRANFYRIDYDHGPASQWAWDVRTGGNFHDYRSFGRIIFG